MTRTAVHQQGYPAIDAADWLFENADKCSRAIERALDKRIGKSSPTSVPGPLRRIVKATLGEEIKTALTAALHVDVMDLLLAGWHRYRALVDAADESVRKPGTTIVVTLADHHVTAHQDGAVDVVFDGRRLLTVTGRLDVDFAVDGVVGVLREGRLVAVRAGQAKIIGTASVQEQQISRRTTHLPLHLAVRLGPGITLAGAHRSTSASHPHGDRSPSIDQPAP